MIQVLKDMQLRDTQEQIRTAFQQSQGGTRINHSNTGVDGSCPCCCPHQRNVQRRPVLPCGELNCLLGPTHATRQFLDEDLCCFGLTVQHLLPPCLTSLWMLLGCVRNQTNCRNQCRRCGRTAVALLANISHCFLAIHIREHCNGTD